MSNPPPPPHHAAGPEGVGLMWTDSGGAHWITIDLIQSGVRSTFPEKSVTCDTALVEAIYIHGGYAS